MRDFLSSCIASYDFPIGGIIPIPTNMESELLSMLIEEPNGKNLLKKIRESLSLRESYNLASFAVRMAILAARRNDQRILEAAFWALLADEDLQDYRDTLTCLAIIEDCLARTGGNFQDLIDRHLGFASPARKDIIVRGYLPRSSHMRSAHTMGYEPVHDQDGTLQYVKRIFPY